MQALNQLKKVKAMGQRRQTIEKFIPFSATEDKRREQQA
jgi:hypothetical protein